MDINKNNSNKVIIENSIQQKQEFYIEELDDSIKILRYISSDISRVDIPDEINGKPVTEIGEECFFLCDEICEIHLSLNVLKIGALAFGNCNSLKEVIFPNDNTDIGEYAFRDCRNLTHIVLPKNLKRLSHGIFSFGGGESNSIILPEKLEVIEEAAFFSFRMDEINIPDSVTQIGKSAFYMGPKPHTKLPYNEAWFQCWPYGELVKTSFGKGMITGWFAEGGEYKVYEVEINKDIKCFIYPGDFIDGIIAFEDEKNQSYIMKEINDRWNSEEKLTDCRKIQDAWRKGFIGRSLKDTSSTTE